MPNTIGTSSAAPSLVPQYVQDLFGEPPLLRGENGSVYGTLMEHFAKLIKPADIIEWWWAKDMTDHTWEIRRLRRFKIFLSLSSRAIGGSTRTKPMPFWPRRTESR